jgi:hypothetical protein
VEMKPVRERDFKQSRFLVKIDCGWYRMRFFSIH